MSNTFTCRRCGSETETSLEAPAPIAEVVYSLRTGSDKQGRATFGDVLHFHFCPDCGLEVLKMLEAL